MIPFSILDLAPITEGSNARRALENSVDLARHAEDLGYRRYWLAEHHNMPGIASAATALVISQVAAATQRIRVGAGGIMLPNHSPLVVAEQFGTLETLFPGRIDLGLGRAPGTDQTTARALRREGSDPNRFPDDVAEVIALLDDPAPGQTVSAIPGAGTRVPVWILGSSRFGAQLAAALGLPYAFASHFAPGELMNALADYREQFRPSRFLEKPYAMVGFNAYVADTDDEARFHASSMEQSFVALREGRPGPIPPPVADYRERAGRFERMVVERTMACSAIGSPETVEGEIERFLKATEADELIVTNSSFDHAARCRSYELLAGVRNRIAAKAETS
ncbi:MULTISPECIES: LLM class flavin-dependent oxidoreductase [unclassified Guyparkeria]|uniref:LLM class flavin-dependent oxidoreductase n=1 Tax=unclassified Guyparkeria TaxID=2626246 RepID=UPI0007337C05|nr:MULTISPECIES: LLM class flavin-dependent oxidoreductase [unclassified Guyparkeria]KTG16308.1 alkane 1-monooxygenase [Guyparkeria sp. XI15]OAE85159.1 alkane 1-monooxygenase [Guyparkeria sp. WRN-7]